METAYVDALRNGPSDLINLFHRRSLAWGAKHAEQTELVNVYNGYIPDRFMEFFHEETHIHLVNMIRLAWDDQAAMTAKEFPIYVEPWSLADTPRADAEKIEKVAWGWNAAGRKCGSLSMRALMMALSHALVGLGEAVLVVQPHYGKKTPYFTWRDPRFHFPPEGWSPWDQAPLTDTMFGYRMPLSLLKRRYPNFKDVLGRKYGSRTFAYGGQIHGGWRPNGGSAYGGGSEEDRYVFVGEYYSDEAWVVSTLEDAQITFLEASEGDEGFPGVQPVVAFGLMNLADTRSSFSDQVSMQAAMSRMFSQKLDYYDQTLYSEIFTSKLAHDEVNRGPGAINYYAEDTTHPPRLDVVAPRHAIDADQMMSFTMGLQRMLNKNPESRQGQGPADSARALDKLMEGITTQIQDGYWPTYIEGLPKGYSIAAQMDMNIWGDVQKTMSGRAKNTPFNVTYTPNLLLSGHQDDILIEPGLGLGGYPGVLEIMQRLGAKLISKRTAFENLPDIRDADDELRRTEIDEVHEWIKADFMQKAAQGRLAPTALGDLVEQLEKGTSLAAAIKQLGEQMVMEQPAAPPGAPGEAPPMGPEDIARMAQSLQSGGTPRPGGGGPPSLRVLEGGVRGAA